MIDSVGNLVFVIFLLQHLIVLLVFLQNDWSRYDLILELISSDVKY